MNSFTLSSTARQIETQFEQTGTNPLQAYLRDETARQLEANALSPSDYDVYLVRRNQLAGDDVIGPKILHAGRYSEDILYGAAGSPMARFRSTISVLKTRAERTGSLGPDDVEYGHQASLLWAEVGRLKEFIGISPVISEIVAELRTARFQFLGKDTPPTAIQAVAAALRLIVEAKRLDTAVVDRVVAILEDGGIDSLAPDVLRDSRG